mmetsp:Transcript_24323/g.36067  ORF Transcript_24323/g.36067 Transcript_24323/m.36067 type:complete len:546 (-) Transcript_24323:26-1663(-)
MAIIQSWHRSVDVRSLLVFRIGLGLYLCYDVVSRLWPARSSIAWYVAKNNAFLEENDSPHGNAIHKIWFARTSVEIQLFLFGVTFLASFSLLVMGRLSNRPIFGIILWILVVSMQHRCMHVHDGSDNFTRQLLLWWVLLPTSVHEQVHKIQKSRNMVTKSKASSSTKNNNQVANLAVTGMLLQISLMYLGTVSKRTIDIGWRGEWLPPFHAVWYVIRDSFAIRETFWLDYLRSLDVGWTQAMTIHAMIAESSPIIWFFVPASSSMRCCGFFVLFTLHLGLLLVTRLPNWQCIGMIASVLWVPTSIWDSLWPLQDLVGIRKKTDSDAPDDAELTEIIASMGTDDSSISNKTKIRVQTRVGGSRTVLTWFFFSYMIYNFAGERRWIRKHDGGDIGEFFRISQYWVMYAAPPKISTVTSIIGYRTQEEAHTTKENATIKTEMWIDVMKGLKRNEWEWQHLDDDTTSLTSFVSPRWERALSQWGSTHTDKRRARHLLKSLCENWVPSNITRLELTWSHYRILAPSSRENNKRRQRWTPLDKSTIDVNCT